MKPLSFLAALFANAGYTGTFVNEDIEAWQYTAEELIATLMTSNPRCAALMDPDVNEVGVGYASVPDSSFTRYWTVLYATGQ